MIQLDIPGELIMKVLAFDADLSKIDQVGQELASSPNLAVSHHQEVT